jgi:hypothetical protein
MMKSKPYFNPFEWVIIILLAVASTMINTYLPVASITDHLGIPGPAAGMALFGGVIFVLWVALAPQITRKKYSGIITSVLIASLCLLIRPWYGVESPVWFSIYGVAALLCLGVIIELTVFRSLWLSVVGGGLGNLACLAITWLAIGFHTSIWVPSEFAALLSFSYCLRGYRDRAGMWYDANGKGRTTVTVNTPSLTGMVK